MRTLLKAANKKSMKNKSKNPKMLPIMKKNLLTKAKALSNQTIVQVNKAKQVSDSNMLIYTTYR